MSSSDSHDDFPSDSGPVLSRDAITPRGGFMARPGLKPPPRHAVVVRGGDAPLSGEIPVARSSFPPPPPPSEPAPISMSEKITLRAIPTPKLPRISSVVFDEPPPSDAERGVLVPPRPVFESAPPPSDAPTVSSIAPSSSDAPVSRRGGSRWTIFAAGAAGLILGLVSVAASTRHGNVAAESPVAAAAPAPAELTLAEQPQRATQVAPPVAVPTPSSSTAPSTASAPAPATQPRSGVKKSIF
jgi:hypothetical protein